MALAASHRNDVAVGLSLVLLFLSSAGTAFAQRSIGSTVAIEGDVSAMLGGRTRHLAAGDRVFSDENIRTSNKSTAKLGFVDKSSLTIGPSASVVVDRSPRKREAVIEVASAVIEVTRGAARWVSGASDSRPPTITTPHATIGVRGTIFELLVEPRRTVIILRSGRIAVCMVSAPRRCVTLDEPQQVVIVTTSTIAGPSPGGLSESRFAENCLSPIDRADCVIPDLPRQVQSIRPSRQVQSSRQVRSIRPSVSQVRQAGSQSVSRAEPGWEGFYAGFYVGSAQKLLALGEHGASQCLRDINFPFPVAPCLDTPFDFRAQPATFTAGGFFGYTVKFGATVVGFESDVSQTRAEASLSQQVTATITTPCGPFCPPAIQTRNELFTGSIKESWGASFRGRFGLLISQNVLVYATGGLALDQVSGSFSYLAVATNALAQGDVLITDTTSGAKSWSDIRVGGTVGGGMEIATSSGFKVRVEYRYTDFGNFSKDIPLTRTSTCVMPCFPPPNTGSTNAHVDMNTHLQTLTVGLAFAL